MMFVLEQLAMEPASLRKTFSKIYLTISKIYIFFFILGKNVQVEVESTKDLVLLVSGFVVSVSIF